MQHQTLLHSAELYSIAQRVLNRPSASKRQISFRALGGKVTMPETPPAYPDESTWRVSLHGHHCTGNTCGEAIQKWARLAIEATRRRATDGRPDCPYNGAGLAPPTPATPAA